MTLHAIPNPTKDIVAFVGPTCLRQFDTYEEAWNWLFDLPKLVHIMQGNDLFRGLPRENISIGTLQEYKSHEE